MAVIDLSRLPSPVVVEALDFETILAAHKAAFLDIYPEGADVLDLESEPVVKLMEVGAYRELLLRQRVNDAARGTMLAYAVGADLEHEAARFGVARLEGESDERLRARTQMALEGFSTAGPRGAYEFHALSASADVLDVAVDSPEPGQVQVTILAADGNGVPDAELLDVVQAALNDERIRPLTDLVLVQAATVVEYAIEAELTTLPGPDANVVLAAAESAAQAYAAAQRRLGLDVTRSGLFAALHQPGVHNVDLVEPAADVVLASTEASYCTAINLTLGGQDE